MNEFSMIRWRCRRGIRELDIILNQYLEQHYETAQKNEQQSFKELLDLEDPVLFSLLLAQKKPANSEQKALLDKLKNMFSSP